MPKIEFTATPKLPADYRHFGYKIGDIIEDRKGWCDKWVNRGVAVYVAETADEAVAETVDETPVVVDEAEEIVDAAVVEEAETADEAVAETRRGRRAR